MARALFLLLAITLAGVGASGQVAQTPAPYRVADAPEAFRDAVTRGDVVVDAMQKAMLGELAKEMQRGGATGAMKACHLAATAVAHEVGLKEGVAAGRTSHKLRNPTNAPAPWAAPIVASHAGKPAAGVDGYVVDLGDRVGLMRPIPFRAACAACHGARERLEPAIVKELKDRYPEDQALDFKEGDLRGWFWVEVPKQPRPPWS
jgi:hypothetical protein